MKKLLLFFIVISLTAAANAGMIVTNLSLDGEGVINATDAYNTTVSPGVGIAAEYLGGMQGINNMKVGLGSEYLFPRAVTAGGYTGFMPVYVTGQYAFCSTGSWKPYVKVNLGYDLVFNGDSAFKFNNSAVLNGGIYYAAGLGSNICKDTIAELMYSTYVGSWSSVTPSAGTLIANDTYTVLGLKIGYCFDLSK
jgi:hypothetical protein